MKARPIPASARKRRQRGAVAIMLGLTLAVLVGFAGLAIDLGRFFVVKSELQNAMDACALAAASQLRPGQNNPNALIKAVAYGRVFSTGGVDDPLTAPLEGNIAAIKNWANFQDAVVDVAPDQITFSNTLAGPYEGSASANYNTAQFARCTYERNDLPILFMKVLNPLLGTQTVGAMAVATLAPSSSSCAIPVAVCKAPGTSAASNFGLAPGQWMTTPSGPGSPYGTGNFGWIDFTPPGGGASELADLLKGPGQCALQIGSPVGEPGSKSSLDVAWNSRFGLYKPGAGNPQPTSVPPASPDETGYSYTTATWPAGANAYAGISAGAFNYENASANHRPYQLTPPNPYKALTQAQHTSLGRKARRVVVAPVVDCTVWNSPGGANPVLEGWACVLMLNPLFGGVNPSLEFLGLSTSPGSPCATNGEPGTFGPLVPQLVQ